MSEHQRETAFLRRIIVHDESDARRELEKSIAQVLHDVRCVQRVASVMALFPLLAIAGFAYGTLLQENFPYNGSGRLLTVLSVVGLASLICLVAFAGLLTVYRRKLNRLREEGRQLVTSLLESRLGKPHIATGPGSHRVSDEREPFQGAAEVSGYPGSLGSLRS